MRIRRSEAKQPRLSFTVAVWWGVKLALLSVNAFDDATALDAACVELTRNYAPGWRLGRVERGHFHYGTTCAACLEWTRSGGAPVVPRPVFREEIAVGDLAAEIARKAASG